MSSLSRAVQCVVFSFCMLALAGCVQVTVQVPNVCGTTLEQASQAIQSLSLVVGSVTRVNSDTVPAGQVMDQVPPAAESVQQNSAVNLTVSLGPVLTEGENEGEVTEGEGETHEGEGEVSEGEGEGNEGEGEVTEGESEGEMPEGEGEIQTEGEGIDLGLLHQFAKDCVLPTFETTVLFNNVNTDTAAPNPANPGQFTLTVPALVTKISVWHDPSVALGTVPSLSIQDGNGMVLGPWTARKSETKDAGGPLVLETTSSVPLKAGQYTLVDTGAKAWLSNAGSENRGFMKLEGTVYTPVTTQSIGPDGGTLTGNGLSLTVPAGALSTTESFSLARCTPLAGGGSSAPHYILFGMPLVTLAPITLDLPAIAGLDSPPVLTLKAPTFSPGGMEGVSYAPVRLNGTLANNTVHVTLPPHNAAKMVAPAYANTAKMALQMTLWNDMSASGITKGAKTASFAIHYPRYLDTPPPVTYGTEGIRLDLEKWQQSAKKRISDWETYLQQGAALIETDAGMSMFRRTVWPLDVYIQEFDDSYNSHPVHPGLMDEGDTVDYDYLEWNESILQEPYETFRARAKNTSVGSQMWLVEYNYYPPSRWDQNATGEFAWLHSACAAWAVTLLESTASSTPSGWLDNAGLMPIGGLLRPLNTICVAPKDDSGDSSPVTHGSVAGMFIKYLVDADRQMCLGNTACSMGNLWNFYPAHQNTTVQNALRGGFETVYDRPALLIDEYWPHYCQELYSGWFYAWNEYFNDYTVAQQVVNKYGPLMYEQITGPDSGVWLNLSHGFPPMSAMIFVVSFECNIQDYVKVHGDRLQVSVKGFSNGMDFQLRKAFSPDRRVLATLSHADIAAGITATPALKLSELEDYPPVEWTGLGPSALRLLLIASRSEMDADPGSVVYGNMLAKFGMHSSLYELKQMTNVKFDIEVLLSDNTTWASFGPQNPQFNSLEWSGSDFTAIRKEKLPYGTAENTYCDYDWTFRGTVNDRESGISEATFTRRDVITQDYLYNGQPYQYITKIDEDITVTNLETVLSEAMPSAYGFIMGKPTDVKPHIANCTRVETSTDTRNGQTTKNTYTLPANSTSMTCLIDFQ